MAFSRTMLEMIHERLTLGDQAPEGICHSSTQNNYDVEASTDFTMTKEKLKIVHPPIGNIQETLENSHIRSMKAFILYIYKADTAKNQAQCPV